MIQNGNNGSSMGPADFAALLGNGNGFGGSGGAIWWMMILFLFAFMFGGNWGGNNGNGNPGVVYAQPYPTAGIVGNDVQRGFDQQSVMNAIGNVGSAVSSGFSSADVARCNQTVTILQALANNATVSSQMINGLAMSLQQCCCDNKAGIESIKYTVATENCQDRQLINEVARDLQAQNSANTNLIINTVNEKYQGIQDTLCRLEIDGIKQNYEAQLRGLGAQIADLQGKLAQASQNNQTATLENYIRGIVNNCCNGGLSNCCGCSA